MRNKGITLVALVVSIIIMLILAGVTLNIALGENGLFNMTQQAVKKYNEKAKEEDNTLKDIEKQLGGYIPDRSMLKVGDEVNYTPRTSETTYILDGNKSGYGDYTSNVPKTMTKATNQEISQEKYIWKIMDINSKTGEVKIMGVPASTNKTVYFQGALGYNNGVYLLDDICKTLYSNSDLGVTARSIDIDDIESKMNDKGKQEKNNYIINTQRTENYTGNKAYYPELYKYQEESNIDEIENTEGISESNDGTKTAAGIPIEHSINIEGYTKAKNSIKVKGTHYDVEQNKTYYDDENFYNLIFKTGTEFWLASRYCTCDSANYCAAFGLRMLYYYKISSCLLFYSTTSNGNINNHNLSICPVVSLGSNIQITREGNEGAWNLSK